MRFKDRTAISINSNQAQTGWLLRQTSNAKNAALPASNRKNGVKQQDCGHMPCVPTDEFTIVRSKDLRGFKNLGGLVDIIDVTRAERPVLSVAEE
jgi:hypothetical protein